MSSVFLSNKLPLIGTTVKSNPGVPFPPPRAQQQFLFLSFRAASAILFVHLRALKSAQSLSVLRPTYSVTLDARWDQTYLMMLLEDMS